MFEFIQYGSDIYRFSNRRCALLEIYELGTFLNNSHFVDFDLVKYAPLL